MSFSHEESRVHALHDLLGISRAHVDARCLPFCSEAINLVVAETDATGREHLLTPETAQAWQQMKDAARADGIGLEIVSAFRSVQRQVDIIRAKLDSGLSIDTILRSSAPPGYSEHHTGRAIDINTPGCDPLEGVFEETAAFRWLTANAQRFGFTMSYPRDNPFGYIHEPWHWCFQSVDN
jgi:D-alanyl-D-alanine carboxypeptidase